MMGLILFFVLSACAGVFASTDKIVVCYYGTWATYRSGEGKFDVEHIDPDLCTHLVYTFIGIDTHGTAVSLDPYLDLGGGWNRDNFRKFTSLKKKNPKLKTLLAVGGYNEGSAKYSVMSANPTYRNNFIQSALQMIQEHDFDGLDIDWEYPNRRDTVHGPADIINFSQLLKELREEFDKHGLMVTIAVSAVEAMASLSYDIPTVVQYVDYVSIMTYDLHGSWDTQTGHNSPMFRSDGDSPNANDAALYTVDNAVKYWLRAGCPPEKLILGLPFYGHSFALSNNNVNGPRSPSSGPGIAGPYSATSGFLGYNEFCHMLKTESWDVRIDQLAQVPYAVRNSNWVSYDNPESIAIKVDYALQYNLGGLMVWSIETDDFHGLCGEGQFPLLNSIHTVLNGGAVGPITTSSTSASPGTSSSSSTTTTSTPAPEAFVCTEAGFVPNPKDCSTYYRCIYAADNSLIAVKFRCPNGLLWDQSAQTCNFDHFVTCNV